MARRAIQSGKSGEGNTVENGNNDGPIGSTGDAGNNVASSSAVGPEFLIIDPASIGPDFGGDNGSGDDNSGEPVRKRRGRKPGSGRKSKAASLDIKGVEGILFSAHTMLAALTKTQELALDKEEANQLAEGIANVSRHYDFSTTQKAMDWTNLMMVCGMVYGTRIFAIRQRKQSERKAAPQAPSTAKPAQPSPSKFEIPGVGVVDIPTGMPQ